MNERKILLFILSVVIYCLYSVHMWFIKESTVEKVEAPQTVTPSENIPDVIEFQKKNDTIEIKQKIKQKNIPLYLTNACSVLEIFTKKPSIKCEHMEKEEESNGNAITVIGITIFLVILVVNAILDVLKVKEEERVMRKLNPNGQRRQSLAEFANKKTLRRESSKFGLQLFQIAESTKTSDEEKKERRQSRIYTRGDSTNSYLSDKKTQQKEGSAPSSVGDTSEPKLVKRQSVAKLFALLGNIQE
ncbi:uncharacterized protein LOC113235893 isoform X2 [Hyposmocoma kahamanoa]|uniref:uncharacterized protein LOC113235893 isoform X2 n=1 Tax=Hyposmocoma kahamanoa TaxID=1477025 RepID=UPI000E6D9CB8|nr:uncharacterized protein LOC113235893 isoform X2 [Hyposmocoma kahamanoa]